METVKDPDILDLERPLPADYRDLVSVISEAAAHSSRYAKKSFWLTGRFIDGFMGDPGKYGRRSLENLEQDTELNRETLYQYARVYRAYSDRRSLSRVLGRLRVSASMMVYLSKLGSDADRDAMERKIQNSKKRLTKRDVARMVALKCGRSVDGKGASAEPVDVYLRLTSQLAKAVDLVEAESKRLEEVLAGGKGKPDNRTLAARAGLQAEIKRGAAVLARRAELMEKTQTIQA